MHVWEHPEGAEARLADAVAALQSAGVKKVASELHGGRPPADVLMEVAEARDVGLAVVSGGRGQRYGLGPVAQRLSHHSPRDLLIVSERPHRAGSPLYGRILIATDGSPTADRAARKGYDLAEALGVPVTLVFVGHPVTGALITEDTLKIYGPDEVETTVDVRSGDPADQILAAAEEHDAGLIVVGNKGMTGAKRFFVEPGTATSRRPRGPRRARGTHGRAGRIGARAGRRRHHRARRREAGGLRRPRRRARTCSRPGARTWDAPSAGTPPTASSHARVTGRVTAPTATSSRVPPPARCPLRSALGQLRPGLNTMSATMATSPIVPIAEMTCVRGPRISSMSSSSLARGTPEGRMAQAAVTRWK